MYLIMQSSRLAISHEPDHFPTLTGEGSKAGWTHIVLQNFSKRKQDLPLRQDSTVPGVDMPPKVLPIGCAGA